jgi:hypothetical protein
VIVDDVASKHVEEEDEEDDDDDADAIIVVVVAAAAPAALASADVIDVAPKILCSIICISARTIGCLLTVGKRGPSMASTNKRAKKSHRSKLTRWSRH